MIQLRLFNTRRIVTRRIAIAAALVCLIGVSFGQPVRAQQPPFLVYTVAVAQAAPTANQLWVSQADGSGQTRLVNNSSLYHLTAAPKGNLVAFVTATEGIGGYISSLTLNVIEIPSGKAVKTLALTPPTTGPPSSASDSSIEVARAITELPSLAWSPDGSKLAFIGAQIGPSADVYLYDLATGKVEQLTDGLSQAITPSWSPNGATLVHAGVTSLGSGAGASLAGVWAIEIASGKVKDLYKPGTGGETIIGWVNPTTFLVYSWDVICGVHNLRAYNLSTQAVEVKWPGYFTDAAYDPASQQLLISILDQATASCTPGQLPGLFLGNIGRFRGVSDRGAAQVVWSASNGIFFAGSLAVANAVSIRGEVTALERGILPVVALNGLNWAGVDGSGALYSGVYKAGNVSRLIASNVRSVAWAD